MLTVAEITALHNLVIKIMKANELIDDHNGTKSDWNPNLIGIHQHGNEVLPVMVCPQARYFCVNELYLDDQNMVHVSTRSVGGVVDMRNMDFDDAVKKYNEVHSEDSPGVAKMHLSVVKKLQRNEIVDVGLYIA